MGYSVTNYKSNWSNWSTVNSIDSESVPSLKKVPLLLRAVIYKAVLPVTGSAVLGTIQRIKGHMSNSAYEYVNSSMDDCRRVGGIFVPGSRSVSNNTPHGIVCVGVLLRSCAILAVARSRCQRSGH